MYAFKTTKVGLLSTQRYKKQRDSTTQVSLDLAFYIWALSIQFKGTVHILATQNELQTEYVEEINRDCLCNWCRFRC